MTSNSELLTMAGSLGLEKFRGVFMADELKGLKKDENERGIVNFLLSSQKGSHWAGWCKRGDEKYYFDSYGADILPQLKIYLGSQSNAITSKYKISAPMYVGNYAYFLFI